METIAKEIELSTSTWVPNSWLKWLQKQTILQVTVQQQRLFLTQAIVREGLKT